MIPRDFYFIAQRHKETRKEKFLRTGMLIATVVNMFTSKDKQPISPWDFVPGGAPPAKQITAKEALEQAKIFAFKHNAKLKAQKRKPEKWQKPES